VERRFAPFPNYDPAIIAQPDPCAEGIDAGGGAAGWAKGGGGVVAGGRLRVMAGDWGMVFLDLLSAATIRGKACSSGVWL